MNLIILGMYFPTETKTNFEAVKKKKVLHEL